MITPLSMPALHLVVLITRWCYGVCFTSERTDRRSKARWPAVGLFSIVWSCPQFIVMGGIQIWVKPSSSRGCIVVYNGGKRKWRFEKSWLCLYSQSVIGTTALKDCSWSSVLCYSPWLMALVNVASGSLTAVTMLYLLMLPSVPSSYRWLILQDQ